MALHGQFFRHVISIVAVAAMERLEFSVSDFFCLTVESQIPVDLRQKEGIAVCRGMRMPLVLPAFERPCRRGMRLTVPASHEVQPWGKINCRSGVQNKSTSS